MTDRPDVTAILNRRRFLTAAAAAAAGATLLGPRARAVDSDNPADVAGTPPGAAAAAGKPNSTINGVRVGCITYSFRGAGIDTAEQTLKALTDCGLSETELMDGPIRAYGALPGPGQKGELVGPAPSDDELAKLREGLLAKAADLRKLYNDAGVNIHIHKTPFGKEDHDVEFNFLMAKALGCKAITTERNDALAKRLAPFAEKHKVYVAFHNHDKNLPQMDRLDPMLDLGQYIAFNLDIGHYVAGTKGKSPIPVIEKYHDRIISLHLKDRTADGGNLPWGQGNTPIKEVLQLLKKEQWPIYGDIELEYKVPQGSTPVAEVQKCLNYCREALA